MYVDSITQKIINYTLYMLYTSIYDQSDIFKKSEKDKVLCSFQLYTIHTIGKLLLHSTVHTTYHRLGSEALALLARQQSLVSQ